MIYLVVYFSCLSAPVEYKFHKDKDSLFFSLLLFLLSRTAPGTWQMVNKYLLMARMTGLKNNTRHNKALHSEKQNFYSQTIFTVFRIFF